MDALNSLGIAAFLSITALFFLAGSRPILFHLMCALLISIFVHWTGRMLASFSIANWLLLTAGLVLYWFGLVIVRVMLTRSVSLRMLSNYESERASVTVEEGIAARLKDAKQFGLMAEGEEGFKLTWFGNIIATIVAISYAVLRIR